MESFHQKVIRNVQNKYLLFKTNDLIGDQRHMPNLAWANSEDVDGFFHFAQQVGAKIMYYVEGELVDEEVGSTQNSILQIGFLYNGVLHHVGLIEDEEDDEEDDDGLDDEDYEDEDEGLDEEVGVDEEIEDDVYDVDEGVVEDVPLTDANSLNNPNLDNQEQFHQQNKPSHQLSQNNF